MNSVLLKLKGYTSEPLNRRAAVRRLERIALALFRLGLFIGLSYVILYPILYMLSTAFRSDADILDTSIVWIPKHFVLNNIKQAFVSLNYPRSLWYTVFYNIVSAVLQIAVTAFVGYGFCHRGVPEDHDRSPSLYEYFPGYGCGRDRGREPGGPG